MTCKSFLEDGEGVSNLPPLTPVRLALPRARRAESACVCELTAEADSERFQRAAA